MFRLLILLLVLPTICLGQKADLEALNDEMYKLMGTNDEDGFLAVCLQIKAASKKLARENNVDYYIADGYFETGQYDLAIKYGNQYLRSLPNADTPRWRLKLNKRMICTNLYKIYKERGDNKKAVEYIRRIENHYDVYFDGHMVRLGKTKMYERMIECYTALGNQKLVDRYTEKLEALNN
ncbi:MAG: hypothetical protein GC178_14180 [Flavobacteriales bacterium]|nr:hypothetical protein [Flavobacteriales bacterium]